jgi:hypothetical protein
VIILRRRVSSEPRETYGRGERREVHTRVLVRELEGKSRIVRSRRRRENDIKIGLKELDRGRA